MLPMTVGNDGTNAPATHPPLTATPCVALSYGSRVQRPKVIAADTAAGLLDRIFEFDELESEESLNDEDVAGASGAVVNPISPSTSSLSALQNGVALVSPENGLTERPRCACGEGGGMPAAGLRPTCTALPHSVHVNESMTIS
jgi:hypothetical protein